MLEKLSAHVRDCHQRAAECRQKAAAAVDSESRAAFLDMEERWLFLARSHEFTDTLRDFTAARRGSRLQPDGRLAEQDAGPDEALRLQEISTLLIQENNVDALYDRVLDAAISLMSADMGSMQVLDHERGELRLLTSRGFHPGSAAFWECVRVDAASTCGLALSSGVRVVVQDTEACHSMAGTGDLDSYRLSNIRAVQSTPLFSRSGRLLGMISTHWRLPHQPTQRALRLLDVLARQAADLIERNQAEAALRRFASIVENSDDGIISLSLDGIVTTWNNGAKRLYGYTAQQMVGKPINLIIPPDRQEEEAAILASVKRGQHVDSFDTVRTRKDGSTVHVSVTVSPVKDGAGRVLGASKIARDITTRKQAQEQVQLLTREVDHRAKNLLAIIQATVHLSDGRTPRELKSAIEGRIQALSNAHTLLAEARWAGVHLGSLIREELLPYCSDQMLRTNISGPELLLESGQAQSLAMVLHELATNAVKYGALSVAAGCVQVNWSCGEDGRLLLRWTEVGGPSTKPPRRQGFGTRVIEQQVRHQLRGEIRLEWRPEGLTCEIVF